MLKSRLDVDDELYLLCWLAAPIVGARRDRRNRVPVDQIHRREKVINRRGMKAEHLQAESQWTEKVRMQLVDLLGQLLRATLYP